MQGYDQPTKKKSLVDAEHGKRIGSSRESGRGKGKGQDLGRDLQNEAGTWKIDDMIKECEFIQIGILQGTDCSIKAF